MRLWDETEVVQHEQATPELAAQIPQTGGHQADDSDFVPLPTPSAGVISRHKTTPSEPALS
jgi:hypothetical protein